jgi:hypothetical protein
MSDSVDIASNECHVSHAPVYRRIAMMMAVEMSQNQGSRLLDGSDMDHACQD